MGIKIKMLGILGNTKKLIYNRTVLFIKKLVFKDFAKRSTQEIGHNFWDSTQNTINILI